MAAAGTGDLTIEDAWDYTKSAALTAWSKTTKRMRAAGVVLLFLYVLSFLSTLKD
jgi:hypothetical protein